MQPKIQMPAALHEWHSRGFVKNGCIQCNAYDTSFIWGL
jgi:hypothetical protein